MFPIPNRRYKMSLRLNTQVRYSYFTYMMYYALVFNQYKILLLGTDSNYARFICFYFSLYKMATIAINALDARLIWGVDDESRPKLIKAVPNQCDSLLSCHVRPISSIKNG